ncbi:MAG: UDP-N-acetylmuramate--L-alanine ligase [Oscillospiraceae bacterium]
MNEFNSKLLDGVMKLHFVGIGGSGMFPMVEILHEVGYEITGSDVNEGDIVNKVRALGINVSMGHKAENVEGAEIVVYSAAIMEHNPEIDRAHELGIPTVERSVLLGYLANTYPHPICISGTHGKTTCTAMTTQILVMAGKDPAAVIGGRLPLTDSYGRYGAGREITIEACEFSNTFLHLVPFVSVILNIDADHLDFFKTMDNLKASFRKFALLTTHTVIANIDDANTMEVMRGVDRFVVTFGQSEGADFRAINIKEERPAFFGFDIMEGEHIAGHISLGAPGKHNVYNALAAYASARNVGCAPHECINGIEAFAGAGRRFEILGEHNGITIADDYAHHPTELRATLETAKSMDFKHVWAVFQPFTYSRTKLLLDDFADVLSIADKVVMTEIMGSRETNDDYNIYTKDLADKIDGSVWFNTFDEVCDYVMANAQDGDLVLTLGCGDIYKAAKKMMKA